MFRKRQQRRQKDPRILPAFFGWILLCLSNIAIADTLLVLSSDSEAYEEVAAAISSDSKLSTQTVLLSEYPNLNADNQFQSVVAIGSKAAISLFENAPEQQKLYATFLPRQTYQSLLENNKVHPRITQRNISAVYLDQPYSRQLSLARLIVPDATKIATALGPNSKKDLNLLKSEAEKLNFSLLYETLSDSDSPIQKLQPLIRNADTFLTLPDKSVFTRTTAKWILYISFRQRIPLIGFSKKYVDAGALAAVFSTPTQIGKQTAELISSTATQKHLPAAQHPRYFSVATNPKAAQALKIQLPSSETLQTKLQELEP